MSLRFATRTNAIEEYYFSKKLAEVRKLANEGADIINLGIGNPDLAPPQAVTEAANKDLLSPDSNGYQPYNGIEELRLEILKWYSETFELTHLKIENVLPLLGSKEGIMYLSLAFLDPGDSALVPALGYPSYQTVTKMVGATPIVYKMNGPDGWFPDFTELEKLDLSKAKIMWVNYPNMPTGQKATDAFFEQLIEFGKRHQIIICNDNPYSLVLNDSPKSLLKFDPNLENVVELNSMSKCFHMAGWRIGMLIGSQEIIHSVLKLKSQVDTGAFRPIQKAAVAALKTPKEWHDEQNVIYRARREKVYELCRKLNLEFSKDQVGMFVWAKAPESVSNVEEFLDKILYEKSVFLTPGKVFGEEGERYVRISLCSKESDLDQAIARLEAM